MSLVRLGLVLAVLLSCTRARAQDARRIGVESAVTVGATALAFGGGAVAGYRATRRCERAGRDEGFLGCGFDGAVVGSVVTIVAMPVALALGSYLPHHGLGGRGRWPAALGGSLLGLGVAFTSMLISVRNADGTAGFVAGVTVGGVLAAALPVLFIEVSHDQNRRVEPTFGAARGGGWLGVRGTL